VSENHTSGQQGNKGGSHPGRAAENERVDDFKTGADFPECKYKQKDKDPVKGDPFFSAPVLQHKIFLGLAFGKFI